MLVTLFLSLSFFFFLFLSFVVSFFACLFILRPVNLICYSGTGIPSEAVDPGAISSLAEEGGGRHESCWPVLGRRHGSSWRAQLRTPRGLLLSLMVMMVMMTGRRRRSHAPGWEALRSRRRV
eukprot:TRINITY_DN16731_c0_g1_i1.p2 TRINITY_DN16731_c0_g1~~TRINITY_DN16731_c0_g1_i1.p2  ORF type:complete len:122 (-),score=4.53 TRINITY_DN16731_c0_g1_i1:75-440(-)